VKLDRISCSNISSKHTQLLLRSFLCRMKNNNMVATRNLNFSFGYMIILMNHRKLIYGTLRGERTRTYLQIIYDKFHASRIAKVEKMRKSEAFCDM
jgi:hypothetical protein